MVLTCEICAHSYIRSHTCKAGVCDVCGMFFKNIRSHQCQVQKTTHCNLIKLWQDFKRDHLPICDACGIQYSTITNTNNFRQFKTIDLCRDCYFIPEIQIHVQSMRYRLLREDVQCGKWKCDLCERVLFDTTTLDNYCRFERDHINVFTKTTTVWELLVSGAPFHDVCEENRKCRNLCLHCHSVVTYAERVVGILKLKKIKDTTPNIEYIRDRAMYQVETLVKMLLEDILL